MNREELTDPHAECGNCDACLFLEFIEKDSYTHCFECKCAKCEKELQ